MFISLPDFDRFFKKIGRSCSVWVWGVFGVIFLFSPLYGTVAFGIAKENNILNYLFSPPVIIQNPVGYPARKAIYPQRVVFNCLWLCLKKDTLLIFF